MELMGVHGGYPVSLEFEACFPISRELEIVGYLFIYRWGHQNTEK